MNKNNLLLILISSLILFSTATYSQEHKRCTQDEAFERLKERDPAMYKSIKDQLEKQKEESSAISKSGIQKAATTKYIIPIVFHVLHTGGPEMISEAQIIDAVRILNEDFNALSPDTGEVDPLFWSIYADIGIEFRLAQIDPNGNCSNGVNYYEEPVNMIGATSDWGNIQAQWSPNQWDYNKYLNIYTLHSGGSWSYGPTDKNSLSGVAVDHFLVGSIGTGPSYGGGWTRTLTHEIGHWFGLAHTWGAAYHPDDPTGCDTDDGIDDTPNTDGTWGCNLNENSCDVGEPGDLKDNTQNYMDYGCSIMFTEGQKTVMINTVLGNIMDNLYTPTNLTNTGTADPYVYGSTPCAPTVEINMDSEGDLCPGTPISYSYYHHNAIIDSVVWSFPGGSPATSTLDKPEITYSASGSYKAILTAYSNGLSVTETLSNAAQISVGGMAYPLTETFESVSVFDSLWTVVNPNGDNHTWKTTGNVSYSGERAMWIRSNINTVNNAVDEVISPRMDLGLNLTQGTVELSFMISTAQNGTKEDKLDIQFTKNCGKTWNQFYSKKGAELATVVSTEENYKPTSSADWRLEQVTLPLGYCVPNVRFKFKFRSNQGSSLFIDDINFVTVGIDDKTIDRSLRIFPNPIKSTSVISFELSGKEDVHVEVYDLLGRRISNINHGKLSKGSHRLELGDAMFDQKGIHIVKIRFNKEVVTRKVVVE